MKPNILLIVTDQQRWDALGCTGGWVRTPHIDSIASEGVRFSNCVTNAPMCVPARVSLATGLYPHNTQVWENIAYDMPTDYATWMQSVRKAGYRTSIFGKTHLHTHTGDLRKREDLLRKYGFDDIDEIAGPRASIHVGSNMTDRWKRKGLWQAYRDDMNDRLTGSGPVARPSVLPAEEYADTYVGQQAKRYLSDYDRKESWFCWVGFGGPHEPWDTPEPYASMYDPADMPAPVNRGSDPDTRHRGVLDNRLRRSPKLSSSEVAALRANYAGNVTLIDDQVGQILAVVRERGELDNTILAFTSDHGEMNGDYGLFYKGLFLNGAVRVPLLIRTPPTITKRASGRACSSLVEWFDIGPTLVDLAGGKNKKDTFGKSLMPVLDGTSDKHRSFAISECLGEIMYLDEEWKLCLNRSGLPYLLFNLMDDPDERINRVTDRGTRKIQTNIRLKILEHMLRTQLRKKRRGKRLNPATSEARDPADTPVPVPVQTAASNVTESEPPSAGGNIEQRLSQVSSMSPQGKCFFIHVGKAGGTYLGAALRVLAKEAGIDIEFTSHQGRIPGILRDNPGSQVIFSVRDPLEIFVSGFYSRQRKGAPRYHREWTPREAEAFARFSTANELAEALSADDTAVREAAAEGMRAIQHVRKNLRGYLKGPVFLRKHKNRIRFIFNQASLDEDLSFMYRAYGLNVPNKIRDNPRLRHENPSDIDRNLSALARRNLVEHYKVDLKIYRTCLSLREEILGKFKPEAGTAS